MYCSNCGAWIDAGMRSCVNCGAGIEEPAENPLIRRAMMFLGESDWGRADDYCEKILDAEPENAMAYAIKLMIRAQVKSLDELESAPESFAKWNSYQNACRFADEALRTRLEQCLQSTEERIRNRENLRRIQEENARREREQNEIVNTYWQACNLRNRDYEKAARLFEKIADYEDSREQAQRCRELLAEQNRKKQEQEAAFELSMQKAEKRKKIKIGVAVALVLAAIIVVISGINGANAAKGQRIEDELVGMKFHGKYIGDGRTTKGGALEVYEEMTEYEITYCFLEDGTVRIDTIERYDSWPFTLYNDEWQWERVESYSKTVRHSDVDISLLGEATIEIDGMTCLLAVDANDVPTSIIIDDIEYMKCD